ncbi:O-antigen polymerase [Microbacterium sp. ARD31]|uniref:O-antigen polymerase n=1 Tax=Microbacterium sp. ARD31 TaxID=2962576 RepID=UPI002882059B|nr:O-antigen polymerase [Microbacterium sp. ARD31]MDT0183367.1 O-antigen polymerase [Microbacterium sp. ARD31]
MTTALLMILATLPPVAHAWFVQRHRGLFNVDAIFVWFQWTMAVGAVLVVDLDEPLAARFLVLSILPLAIYCLTSFVLFWRSTRTDGERETHPRGGRVLPMTGVEMRWAWGIFLVSAVITIAYFVAVGYNVFLLGIRGLFTGETFDYTTLRLESYAPSRYLFPGYVNQFRNVLLPATALALAWNAYRDRHRLRHVLAAFFGAASLVSLMGTGQRGAFVLFLLVTIVFLRWAIALRFGRPLLIGALVAVPALFFATLLLGRSQADIEEGGSRFGAVATIGQELLERFFIVNQRSGYDAVIFIQDRSTVWGQEWLQGIAGLTPWSSGSPLAKQVFEHLYGSDRGTSPITLWGSVYYNFWWWGVVLVPILLALATAWLVRRIERTPSTSALESVGMAGVTIVLGTWVAGAPDQMVNNGLVAFAVLWWVGARLRVGESPLAVLSTIRRGWRRS